MFLKGGPDRRYAITQISCPSLLIGHLGTHFSDIFFQKIAFENFPSKKPPFFKPDDGLISSAYDNDPFHRQPLEQDWVCEENFLCRKITGLDIYLYLHISTKCNHFFHFRITIWYISIIQPVPKVKSLCATNPYIKRWSTQSPMF